MPVEENIFQLFDWHAYDQKLNEDEDTSEEENYDDEFSKTQQEYKIYLFGINPEGKNVAIKVVNYRPFFWIQLPSKWKHTWTSALLDQIQGTLPRKMRDELIIDDESKKIYKKFIFRDYQWNIRRLFLKISFKSEAAQRMAYYSLKKKTNLYVANLRKHNFPIFEKNVPPVLRFIHLKGLKPSSWIKITNSAKKVHTSLGETIYENWTVDWNDVSKLEERDTIGPLIVASFDIEADSSHGDFPLAKKDYSKLATEIYEEFIRCKKIKITLTPSRVKQWLKCAFRNYLENEKFNDDLTSSFQNIFLKSKNGPAKNIYDKLSTEIYRELSKFIKIPKAKAKAKEITPVLTEILNNNLPVIEGDKIIQIGTVSYIYGQERTSVKRHIVTLGGCTEINGVEVVACNTVPQLIKAWIDYVKVLQPNIITGYNIFGFDFKFIWECADEHDCLDMLEKFSPVKNFQTTLETKELFSAALGHNFLYYFKSPGIVLIDLMKVIQKDHNLSSYKLDDVSTDFINGKISNLSYDEETKTTTLQTSSTFSLNIGQYIVIYEESIVGKENIGSKSKIISIKDNKEVVIETLEDMLNLPVKPKSYFWAVGKDNVSPHDIFELQGGNDDDRAIVAKYCVQDCELCLSLMQKLEIVANNIGMSNVCLVPLSYLFMRGQMIKTLSLVASECYKENYLIPELPRPDENVKESYEGAEVLEPTPAIHLDDPISVLDYGSLYPSSMIGTNISHDTIITDEKYLGEEGGKILKEKNLDYEDVTYDNYVNTLHGKTWKKTIHPEQPRITCRYIKPSLKEDGQIDESKRGILPRILMKLLKARKDTRKLIKAEKDPFRRSVLDGLQLAYKVTANSLYGGVGAAVSALYYKDIAASTTAVGRQHLHLAKDYVNTVYPEAEVIYGDSVSYDTPILLKVGQNIKICSPEEIFVSGDETVIHSDGKEWFNLNKDIYVWTEHGWTRINQIIRHKVNKDMFRVITHTSSVDVTEDHSLIDNHGNEISPKDTVVGDYLMTSFPTLEQFPEYDTTFSEDEARIMGNELSNNGKCENNEINLILNSPIKIRTSFLESIIETKDYIDLEGKIAAMGIYTLLHSIGYNVSINNQKRDIYRISFTKNKLRKEHNKIKKIIKLPRTEQYVYDLSTENHHFHAGIGQCIVHNTDSIFVNFKPKSPEGEPLKGKEAIQASIDMALAIENGIQKQLQYPHKLEYEKTFYPFILLRKKGYIGNKYEFDLDHYKQTSMGVVTKRRDNAPIVKYVYDGVIRRIINDRDIQASIAFLKDTVKKILAGEFPMAYFIITKRLRSQYANPEQIVHKVLADRMGERDSGNKPQSNDRIPYVYIKTKNPVNLQGDRVEHPDYIRENNLKIDYPFYITNQVQKPVCQVYALALESLREHGYKLSPNYFDKLKKTYEMENKKDVRDKVMDKKKDEVYNVLFKKVVDIEQGKQYGQRSISDFFNKK